MNPFTGLKRLVGMVFKRPAYGLYHGVRARVGWYKGVGDITNSSTVAATVMWCARNFPEAPPALWQRRDDGQEEQVLDHPMLRLLQRPNKYYSGVLLWMATVTDWKTDGNAYWLKVRDQTGLPAELWWVPSWMMEPVGSTAEYITHYEYSPNGQPLRVDVENVVHFRFGIDPDNPLKGRSPLQCVLREVFTDDEAATFTASILANMGVPGLIVSPEEPIDQETAENAKREISESFTGVKRGEPMVMKGPTKIAQFGFSPEQLLLRELRRIPEERVTAALGVPAIVVGLGAGLDRSTFTNMGEAGEYAYSNGLIPDQRIMAPVVQWQLLVEYEDDPYASRFGFDLTKVRALQEDQKRLADRWNSITNSGLGLVSEGRRALGLPVDEARDNIFLRQGNITQVPADGGAPLPLAPSRDRRADVAAQDQTRATLELAAAVSERPDPVLHLYIDPPDVHVESPDVHVDVQSPHVTVEAGEPHVVNVEVAAPDMAPIGAALAERKPSRITVERGESNEALSYTVEG